MKREDIARIFEGATKEQIDQIMAINGADINAAKSGADKLKGEAEAAQAALDAANATIADLRKSTGDVKALQVKSYRKTGQAAYENIFNLIEARNNDGSCPLNKATYSSELCEKLLSIYAKPGSVVYDPFMGSGTTAVACMKMGFDCIGSEISAAQCEYARNRLVENRSS